MPKIRSLNRILVTGREVGPIVRLLKKENPNTEIGAVDVLGNLETRNFADWNFSVEKQAPGMSILRKKHRNLIELLCELTLIMLEDIEFDLLILLSPFHAEPNYIHNLSREIEIAIPDISSLKSTSSSYRFLTTLNSQQEFLPSDNFILNLGDNQKNLLFLHISKQETKSFNLIEFQKFINSTDQVGFIIPYSQIYCAFFISFPQWLNFLGVQTVTPPYQHQFFFSYFEKNALVPFSMPSNLSIDKIRTQLSKIVRKLNLVGLITLYFCLIEDKIIPISCTALPDENFDLWESRVQNSLIPYLLSKSIEEDPHMSCENFAFKLPIYSKQPIRVPTIPEFVSQRNLAGVISSPEYPLCIISGYNPSFSILQRQLKQKKEKILKFFAMPT